MAAIDDNASLNDLNDEELQRLVSRTPGAKLGGTMPAKASTPDPDEQRRQQTLEALQQMRDGMDATARLAKAEGCKTQANDSFGQGSWKISMVGYIAAIWFLKRGSPTCPAVVAGIEDSTALEDVESTLGAGNGEDAESDAVVALRTTCHLNLAQSALKMEEWAIAQAACTYVLQSADGNNAKALFRLAKARQGAAEIDDALATITRLLKREPTNAEARKLHEALKQQRASDNQVYAGMFDRHR